MATRDTIFSNKHPKEMYLLALTDMTRRFAFWGIGYTLVLLLVNFFDYSSGQAVKVFAIFTGLSFLLPILGGYIADKWARSSQSKEMQYAGLGLYILIEAIIFLPLLFMA